MRARAICAVVVLGTFGLAHADVAPTILPGWELYRTDPDRTWFDLDKGGPMPPTPFAGVPIGSFDFGDGRIRIGETDTIVRRMGTATPDSPAVPVRLERLQLAGRGPVPLFLTLQSDRGRNPLDPPSCCESTGLLDILFSRADGGTAKGTFIRNLDVRLGDVNGPIVSSITVGTGPMQTSIDVMFNPKEYVLAKATPWKHHDVGGLDAPTLEFGPFANHGLVDVAALLIPGVNTLLNGRDTTADIHLGCPREPC